MKKNSDSKRYKIELEDKVTGKIFKGNELTYKVYDKYGYILLDDKLIYNYRPIFTPDELHEHFKNNFQMVLK